MKKLIFLIFLIFSCHKIYSQYGTSNSDDKAKIIAQINNQFSKMVNTSGNSSLGGFLGVDLRNADVKFNINGLTTNGNVYNIGFSSGVNNGVTELFKNNNVNTNFKVQFGFNKNLSKVENQFFQYSGVILYNQEIEKIMNVFIADSLKLIYLDSIILNTETQISNLKTKLNDTLSYKNFEINEKIRKLNIDLNSYSKFKENNGKLSTLRNTRTKSLKSITPNLTFDELNMKWISLLPSIGRLKQNWFKNFSDSALLKTPLSNYGLEIGYNQLKWSSKSKSFFRLAVGIFEEEFINGGVESTFVEQKSSFSNSGLTRIEKKEYNAISGGKIDGRRILNLYFDYYKFLNNNDNFAFRISPNYRSEINRNSDKKYLISLTYGVLLNLNQTKSEAASRLNIEIFNKISSSEFASITSIIGINFVLPLNFNILK